MDHIIRYIRNASIVLAIALFFLYRPTSPDLLGHWHVQRIPGDTILSSLKIVSIDIINDTTAILNRNVQYGGMNGYLDQLDLHLENHRNSTLETWLEQI